MKRPRPPFTPAGLRTWRKRLGWSQDRLARELGIAYYTILHWEHGDNEPSPLAHLGLKRLGFKEPPPPPSFVEEFTP